MKNDFYSVYEPNEKVKFKKDARGDCVIRAITLIEKMEWLDVFDELTIIARKNWDISISQETFEIFLNSRNYIYHTGRPEKGGKRETVKGFAQKHPKGTYFLRVANHVVAVENGKYYDSWDSGNCCLYSYWEKPI